MRISEGILDKTWRTGAWGTARYKNTNKTRLPGRCEEPCLTCPLVPFWGPWLKWIQHKVLVERERNARQLEELRSEAGGVVGGERWSRSIFMWCSIAIQWRCLSTSNCSELISINGIFLLSHSIRFSFSQILLDCPSEAFSIGLLNNANAPLPYMDLCPPFCPASPSHRCIHFISSFREETGNNDLLHPEECPSPCCCPPPPGVTAPNFLNLNKMRIPQSLKNASPSVLHARIHSTPFTRLTPNPLSSSPILPSAPRNVCPSAAPLSALCSSLNCKVPMFSQRESLNTPCQQRTHTQSLPLYTDTLERKKNEAGEVWGQSGQGSV